MDNQDIPKLSMLGKLFESGKATHSPISLGPPLIVYVLITAATFEFLSDTVIADKSRDAKDCLLLGAILLGLMSIIIFYAQIRAAYADEKAAIRLKYDGYADKRREQEKREQRRELLSILHLEEDATNADIDKQAKTLLKKHHPDSGSPENADIDLTRKILDAKKKLTAPDPPITREERDRAIKNIRQWERDAGRMGRFYAKSARTPIYTTLLIKSRTPV